MNKATLHSNGFQAVNFTTWNYEVRFVYRSGLFFIKKNHLISSNFWSRIWISLDYYWCKVVVQFKFFIELSRGQFTAPPLFQNLMSKGGWVDGPGWKSSLQDVIWKVKTFGSQKTFCRRDIPLMWTFDFLWIDNIISVRNIIHFHFTLIY